VKAEGIHRIDRMKDREEGEGMRDEAADQSSLIHPFALLPHPFFILSILSILVNISFGSVGDGNQRNFEREGQG
jgi:hypothetical protein